MFKACLGFNNAMCELIGDHINGGGKTIKELTVSISNDQLFSIPKGVIKTFPVVDNCIERHSLVVDGVPFIQVPEEIVSNPKPVISLIDGNIACRRITLATGNVTW